MVAPFTSVVLTLTLGAVPSVVFVAVKYAKVAPTTATSSVATAITVNKTVFVIIFK